MKKLIMLMTLVFLLSGCSKEAATNVEKVSAEKFDKLVIQTNLLNKEAKDESYNVYLILPGTRETEAGEAFGGAKYGPFETDKNGKVEIDLNFNWDIEYYMETEDNKMKNKMEVIVVTKEDKYVRNILNKETYVEFIKNEDEATSGELKYSAASKSFKVDFTDKLPKGVLSLAFPDATFVIKLKFAEGFVPTTSYEVSIYKPSATASDGLSMYRLGRIDREFQYWDTPFFATDQLKNWSGTIIVTNYETNARVEYEGYPKQITFDDNGKCKQGDIVEITIK